MGAPFCGCWGAAGYADVDEEGQWGSSPVPRHTCRCAEARARRVAWRWEARGAACDAHLSECRREVTFHGARSLGTAVARGERALAADAAHYWEIKILTALYGTDVMIGVGSSRVDCDARRREFVSFLGLDEQSYGVSYKGHKQHAGAAAPYCAGFGKGAVVGVLLDTWRGTLEYYLNRRPLGVAFAGLRRHNHHPRALLRPMVSSTAAQSAVRLIYAMSLPASLAYRCARTLADCPRARRAATLAPGLRDAFDAAFWLLLPSRDVASEGDTSDEESNSIATDVAQVSSSSASRPPGQDNLGDSHDKLNIDLWNVALGAATSEKEDTEKEDSEKEELKSFPRLPALCHRCNERNGEMVVMLEKTQLVQCVECFHDL